MGQTIIRDISIPAGGDFVLDIPGRFFAIIGSSSPVNVEIRRNNTRIGRALGVEAPIGIGPAREAFHGLRFESSDASAQTLKIAISDDPIAYNRLTGDVTIDKADGFDGVADVTLNDSGTASGLTTLLAADAARRAATITNLSGNPETLRIGGDGSTGAAQGTPLAPGQSMSIEGTAAIVAYNPGVAADVAISVTKD